MLNSLRRTGARIRRVFRLIVLFIVLRMIAGVAMIALFRRDAVAWGPELTAITVGVFAVCIGVALAVRRWSPPREKPASR
jgi:hypothetical protein